MKRIQNERGFSLIELLVAMGAFSIVAFAFLSVMMSTARSTDTTRDNVRISEEARLGLNRMVRDTREAAWIDLPGTDPNAAYNSFTVKIDFDGNGTYANPPGGVASAEGNFEVVTYAYEPANDAITLTAPGFGTETLIKGVDCARTPAGACKGDVFSFTSNRLEYDVVSAGGVVAPDGVVTLDEVNDAACSPLNITTMDVCNGTLVDAEMANLTSVNFAFRVEVGGRSTDYYAEAQLRNRR